MMNMKRLLWGFMLVVAVALAGCSSDGDGGRIAALEDILNAVNQNLSLSEDDFELTQQKVKELTDNLKVAEEDVMTLKGELDTTQDRVVELEGQLAARPTQEDVTNLQKELEIEKDKVTQLTGELLTANTTINNLRDQITELRGPTEDAMAAALSTAINAADADRPGGATVDFTIDDTGQTIVGADDADTQSILGEPTKDDDDMINAGQFQEDMTASRAALTGFDVSVHERTEDKTTDTLTVYTNMADPGDQVYTDYYATARHEADAGKGGVTYNADNMTLVFTHNVAYDATLFSGSGFPDRSGDTRNTPEDDSTTEDMKENVFDGIFNGMPGQYTCGAGTDGCDATLKDGKITLSEDWTFKPTDDKYEIPGVVPDDDFLSFGYWVQQTEADDGTMSYGVNTFYAGAAPYPGGNMVNSDLEGTATYKGSATGIYVEKEFNDADNAFVAINSGQFTANAELMASFGGNDVAVNDKFTVKGTVDNFMDANGDFIDSMWSVALGKTESFSGSNTFSGSTLTGETGFYGTGTWGGQFFGNTITTDDSNTTVDETLTDYPTGVAGDFDAEFMEGSGQNPGYVIGAFGATETP